MNSYSKKVETKNPLYFNQKKSLNAALNYLTLDSSQELKNKPNYFSMWYVDDKTNQTSDLTEINKENLLLANNLETAVRVLFKNGLRIKNYEGKSGYEAIYHIFKNGSLLYYFPAPPNQTSANQMMDFDQECIKKETGKVLFIFKSNF